MIKCSAICRAFFIRTFVRICSTRARACRYECDVYHWTFDHKWPKI